VEVVLRMLVVKRLYGYSYEETVARVSDSLNLRQFCRLYLNDAPVDTTLLRWANLIQPKTLRNSMSGSCNWQWSGKSQVDGSCAPMEPWWKATFVHRVTIVC
jgi:hypothetical protein